MKYSFSFYSILLLVIFCLSGCGNAYYEDGYSKGYDDGYGEGYSDCLYENEDKYFDYGDEMYSEGFSDGAEAATEYISEAFEIYLMWDNGIFILEEYFDGQCSRSDAILALEDMTEHLEKAEEAIYKLRNGKVFLG